MENLVCVKAVDCQRVTIVKYVDMEWILPLDVLSVYQSTGTRTLQMRKKDVEVCLGKCLDIRIFFGINVDYMTNYRQ